MVFSEVSPTLAWHASYLDVCSELGMGKETTCVLYYILICFVLMVW